MVQLLLLLLVSHPPPAAAAASGLSQWGWGLNKGSLAGAAESAAEQQALQHQHQQQHGIQEQEMLFVDAVWSGDGQPKQQRAVLLVMARFAYA